MEAFLSLCFHKLKKSLKSSKLYTNFLSHHFFHNYIYLHDMNIFIIWSIFRNTKYCPSVIQLAHIQCVEHQRACWWLQYSTKYDMYGCYQCYLHLHMEVPAWKNASAWKTIPGTCVNLFQAH